MPKGYPGTLTHSASAYFNGRCKCDVCREAANAHRRNRDGQMTWDEWTASILPAHGTEGRYTGPHHCRCADCREASRLARARRRKAERGKLG